MRPLNEIPFSTGFWDTDGRRHATPRPVDDFGPLPLLPTRFKLHEWGDGRPRPLMIYIDPGADISCIRLEWFLEHDGQPVTDPDGYLRDPCFLEVDGEWLDFPQRTGPRVYEAGTGKFQWGSEDALLGRDFLLYHGVLLTFDFARRCFTLAKGST